MTVINYKNLIFISIALFFCWYTYIERLPANISNSRAPWIDESLKNYIGKNLIEHNIAQPYENNEFRKSWQKVPVYTIWTLPFIKIFGVGYTQVRILSFLTAFLALFIFSRFISIYGIKYKFLLLATLLTNPGFIYFSRLGTYESLFLLLSTIAIYCLYKNNRSNLFVIISGLVCLQYYLVEVNRFSCFYCLLDLFNNIQSKIF